MSAQLDTTPAGLRLSDPALQEVVLNGRAKNLDKKKLMQQMDEAMRKIMTQNELDELVQGILKQPELANRYEGRGPEVQKDVLRLQANLARRDFLNQIDVKPSAPSPEAEDVENLSARSLESKGILHSAWEKAKTVLAYPFKHPLKTVLMAAIAWLAAPQILTLVANSEFAAANPAVMRTIDYMRAFLSFGSGGTGVKPDSLLEGMHWNS